jgi:hypothetical protein
MPFPKLTGCCPPLGMSCELSPVLGLACVPAIRGDMPSLQQMQICLLRSPLSSVRPQFPRLLLATLLCQGPRYSCSLGTKLFQVALLTQTSEVPEVYSKLFLTLFIKNGGDEKNELSKSRRPLTYLPKQTKTIRSLSLANQ